MSSSRPTPIDREVPIPLRLTAAYLWRLALVAGAIWVLADLVGTFATLVVPFLVAVLLAALLLPLVDRLTRWIPRGLAVFAAIILTLATLGGLFTLVGTQVAGQLAELSAQAVAGFAKLQEWFASGPLQLGSAEVTAYLQQATDQLSTNSSEIARRALTVTAGAGEVLTGLALAIFSLIFLLADGRGIWLWAVRLLPRAGRESADAAGRAGWLSLTSYVRATILVALVDAVGIGVGAALLGVPLAVPLAILVFLGAFIPIVGALVSGVVAVLVALLALGFVKALIMLGVVLLVQQVESHLLQPLLMGRMVSLHPLGVVMAIGTGIILGGITGALFAVPLVAMLNAMAHTLAARDSDKHVASIEREMPGANGVENDESTSGRSEPDTEIVTAGRSAGATAADRRADGSSKSADRGEATRHEGDGEQRPELLRESERSLDPEPDGR